MSTAGPPVIEEPEERTRVSLLDDGFDETEEINLSPMIDCIFILLIFFIVTTVFVEEPGIEIYKPDATTDEQLEKNSIIIAISADNKVVYGGKELGSAASRRPWLSRCCWAWASGSCSAWPGRPR